MYGSQGQIMALEGPIMALAQAIVQLKVLKTFKLFHLRSDAAGSFRVMTLPGSFNNPLHC